MTPVWKGLALAILAAGAAFAQDPSEPIDSDEVTRELANPNTSLASLTLKFQQTWFGGDLPKANRQMGSTLLFQPVLPFPLKNKAQIMLRPAVPFILDQPLPDETGGYHTRSGIGDISFDAAYAFPSDPDAFFNLMALGGVFSLPTASDSDLGTGQWSLGPEILLGRITPAYVAGVFPSHQWSVGGWSDLDVSRTTLQPILLWFPGGGWDVGTTPSITYDWKAEQWTIPLQITAGKSLVIHKRPWKVGCSLNYYVERDDDFASEWILEFSITPVVENGLANLFNR